MEDVIVHDVDPVQNSSKSRDILHRVTVGICEWFVLSCSCDAGRTWEGGTKELKHRQEVRTILRTNNVITFTLYARIFPVDVDAVKVVLLIQRNYVLDESLPRGGTCTCGREVPDFPLAGKKNMTKN